jgi:hypothetical protein
MKLALAREAAATGNDTCNDEQSPDNDTIALTRACVALWMATLSLMTAFMHNPAPAHRVLIARKIARNLGTLHEQECFTSECRMIFSNLSQRWQAKANSLADLDERPRGGVGMLQPALVKIR